ncbi:MAG: CDP-archaeol synthase [Proteobacteria bacterium]|nr:CDP-archaeol synthase [Pseudomonadota bacterium]
MNPVVTLQVLMLLGLANGAPVVAKRFLRNRCGWPLDAGLRFVNGRPLLGASKTLRGVLVSILATAAGAAVIGLDASLGAWLAGAAMAGDSLSSFVKRRLDLPSSSRATGLDQIPESLLPLLVVRDPLSLGVGDMIAIVALFFIGEVLISRPLYRLKLRDRPY